MDWSVVLNHTLEMTTAVAWTHCCCRWRIFFVQIGIHFRREFNLFLSGCLVQPVQNKIRPNRPFELSIFFLCSFFSRTD